MKNLPVAIPETAQGRIITSVGGLYTVETFSGICTCKARGIFRKRGITPYVGDYVQLSEDGVIQEILPRKNSILRPPVSNLDQIFFVVSTCHPAPNLLLLDSFLTVAIYQDIQPAVVLTKMDLHRGEQLEKLYTDAGIPVYPVEYDKPETIAAVSELLAGKISMMTGNSGVGKSTLLNAITGAGIPANDRLFDTLDTTTRLLTVSDTLDVVISDTVGFIRKLPHQLVEAFKATLEELEYADLLLHVIDASNPEWREQAHIVDELIRELGAEQIPCIRVYNKCDVAFTAQQEREADAVYISAKTGEGIPALLSAVDKKLDKGTKRVVIHLPYDKTGLLDGLYREAKVENVAYGETVDVTAVCTPRIMGQLKDYIEGWVEPKEDWE